MSQRPLQRSATYAEIMRQPKLWTDVLGHLRRENGKLKSLGDRYAERTWVFCGCGTSYYLAQTAAHLFGYVTGIPVKAVPASEVLMFPDSVFHGSCEHVFVAFSRSGTTTETLKAVRKVQEERDIPALAVSCDPDSHMVQAARERLTFPFPKEKSVVMTGSFTCMLLACLLLALKTAGRKAALEELPGLAERLLAMYEPMLKRLCSDPGLKDFVFLGQGPMFGVASEAALKIQEMALVSAQRFHSLEYRHGPMSTATGATLITLLGGDGGTGYEVPLLRDLKALGAKTLVFHGAKSGWPSSAVDYEVDLGGVPEDIFEPLLCMPLLHLLGYYRAVSSGIDPDKPKNLSQVVVLA